MLSTDTIKVQVVYDDALVAAGLMATLRDQPGVEVLAESHLPDRIARPHGNADVIVADYQGGLDMLGWPHDDPRGRYVSPPLLIVTARDSEAEIRFALKKGARGYLLLGCSVDDLVDAVRSLRAGTRYIGARAAQRLADSVACESLTGRERAVLRLVVEGLANKAIANRLDVAIGTVKFHLKAIFQKLNATSRTEAATLAQRRGLLALSGEGMPRRPVALGQGADLSRAHRGDPRRLADLQGALAGGRATH
jgi:two-component system NarL family response regulator